MNLRLSLAPKAIDKIVNKIVPDAYVVSFKVRLHYLYFCVTVKDEM